MAPQLGVESENGLGSDNGLESDICQAADLSVIPLNTLVSGAAVVELLRLVTALLRSEDLGIGADGI